MPPKNYRLYCLNGRGGINLADWIKTDTDEEAILKAQEVEHGAVTVEVWEQDRLIATLKDADVDLYPSVHEAVGLHDLRTQLGLEG